MHERNRAKEERFALAQDSSPDSLGSRQVCVVSPSDVTCTATYSVISVCCFPSFDGASFSKVTATFGHGGYWSSDLIRGYSVLQHQEGWVCLLLTYILGEQRLAYS